jgi:hypothetical protein
MSPDPTPQTETDVDAEAEAPDADVMQRVATALEATESGGPAPAIVRADGDASPLPPRRGS